MSCGDQARYISVVELLDRARERARRIRRLLAEEQEMLMEIERKLDEINEMTRALLGVVERRWGEGDE